MLNYTCCFSVNFMLLSSVVQTLGSAIRQAPVVQKVDNAIDWINLYPLDNTTGLLNIYMYMDSDLSGG